MSERRGRLAAYAWWQLRDYAIAKGIGTVLVSAIMIAPLYVSMRQQAGGTPIAGLGTQRTVLLSVIESFILFGVLFATNGIVAEDRRFGYYRFYFAKPVGVVAFYLQKLLVHLAGFLAISGLLLLAINLLFGPVVPPFYFPLMLALFVGFGGVGFLLSTLTTVDWISLIGVWGISLVGWRLYGTDPGWRGALVHLLPPVHRLKWDPLESTCRHASLSIL